MFRLFHDGMVAHVTDNGTVSEAFVVTDGVKQDYFLPPTPFSLMFPAMKMAAYLEEHPEMRVDYRTYGQLLNHRRMHFQSRVSATTVHELFFTDDCVLEETTEEDMQRSMGLFTAVSDNFDTGKTVVMHKPPPIAAYTCNCAGAATSCGLATNSYPNNSSMEMTLRVLVDKQVKSVLQGHSEDFLGAPADQLGQLGRPSPRPTGLVEDSEDRLNYLRSRSHDRCQSQT
ncbi:hypothetical protein SprV_0501901300 [Sparganum proliferum]